MAQKLGTVVVKIGTSSLTDRTTGDLKLAVIGGLAEELTRLRRLGWQVVLVSSGAVGVGAKRLGMTSRPTTLEGKQATAAVGQGLLMSLYDRFFSFLDQPVAQILLTRLDLVDRDRYLNIYRTLHELFALGVIPVINENDTVAVEELKFGDNDTLSARVSTLVKAKWLILFTDVAGLYSANPHMDPEAQLIAEVGQVSAELDQLALGKEGKGNTGSTWGTGGMVTKLEAARIATAGGITMVITDGSIPQNLPKILAGEAIGTKFLPQKDPMNSRQLWIAYGLVPQGKLLLDKGAVRALQAQGKSLLPAGIQAIEGKFKAQSLVDLCDLKGKEFARGLVNYSSKDLSKLLGQKSVRIPEILGYEGEAEAVHRDNLVLLAAVTD
jgi:glutamate 5-kinase